MRAWEFNTRRFVVALDIEPEPDAPEDQFDDPRDVAFARNGDTWSWFVAHVTVAFRDADDPKHWAVMRNRVIGEDYLGGCSYRGREDFLHDGYFHDMVHEAIREARGTLARMGAVQLRAA